MTPEAIRIAMAELDGYFNILQHGDETYYLLGVVGNRPYGRKLPRAIHEPLPTYDTLDDTQRVFKGLTKQQKQVVFRNLFSIHGIRFDDQPFSDFGLAELLCIAESTPPQWQESILGATGKWKEGES